MLARCIESLGRCGDATLRRPSSFRCVLPGGWCPAPGSPFAVSQSCRPQCCCHTDPGSWTGTIPPASSEYKKCQLPICSLEPRLGDLECVGFVDYVSAV